MKTRSELRIEATEIAELIQLWKEDEATARLVAIQSDAREDLLSQNQKMREILDSGRHAFHPNGGCWADCIICKWQAMKKEMK